MSQQTIDAIWNDFAKALPMTISDELRKLIHTAFLAGVESAVSVMTNLLQEVRMYKPPVSSAGQK